MVVARLNIMGKKKRGAKSPHGSTANGLGESDPPQDLGNPDLHLVTDLGARNEDHEVLDPRDTVALAADILDLDVVGPTLLDGGLATEFVSTSHVFTSFSLVKPRDEAPGP